MTRSRPSRRAAVEGTGVGGVHVGWYDATERGSRWGSSSRLPWSRNVPARRCRNAANVVEGAAEAGGRPEGQCEDGTARVCLQQGAAHVVTPARTVMQIYPKRKGPASAPGGNRCTTAR